MRALGYPVILGGAFLLRQAMIGRAKESATDAKDAALAFLRGDMVEVSSVFSRQGDTATFLPAGSEVATTSGATSLITAMQSLGAKAKGYRIGASGPDYYDCSGLLWQAMKTTGVYTGMRFTTHTFLATAKSQGWPKVSTPSVGDIVVWQGVPYGHIGIVTGPNRMYSAMNPSAGIGSSSINGFHSGTPTYVRVP